MQDSDEVKRIRRAYAEMFSHDPSQKRWNPMNPGNKMSLLRRGLALKKLLIKYGRLPGGGSRILDIGCGSGGFMATMLDIGTPRESLSGVDLLPDRINVAQTRYPDIHFFVGNAEKLDIDDSYYDLVVFSTCFSSVLDLNMAHRLASEAHRVLKQGGAIIWYDLRYNNPMNRHVRGVTRAQIRELFPNFALHLTSLTLIPQLARNMGFLTHLLYPALAAIPILRTHYLGLLVKP